MQKTVVGLSFLNPSEDNPKAFEETSAPVADVTHMTVVHEKFQSYQQELQKNKCLSSTKTTTISIKMLPTQIQHLLIILLCIFEARQNNSICKINKNTESLN
jgi:SUMO ligase MMS21 Smc5/6 complex component